MSETNDDNVPLAFALTFAAGLSTVIGAAAPFMPSSKIHSPRALSAALGLAAGVMLYISFVDILATKAMDSFEAIESIGEELAPTATGGFFFLGIFAIAALNALTHRIGAPPHSNDVLDEIIHAGPSITSRTSSSSSTATRTTTRGSGSYSEYEQEEEALGSDAGLCSDDSALVTSWSGSSRSRHRRRRRQSSSEESFGPPGSSSRTIERTESGESSDMEMGSATAALKGATTQSAASARAIQMMGIKTAVAIMLHNLPEGLATFVATLASPSSGVAIMVAIGLHNVPEGSVVSMPIFHATGSKWRGFFWGAWSGVTEPIGAIFGYLVLRNNESDWAYGVLFALVAGMMVYVTLRELLPTAHRYDPSDKYVTWFAIFGMFVMALSLSLFAI